MNKQAGREGKGARMGERMGQSERILSGRITAATARHWSEGVAVNVLQQDECRRRGGGRLQDECRKREGGKVQGHDWG